MIDGLIVQGKLMRMMRNAHADFSNATDANDSLEQCIAMARFEALLDAYNVVAEELKNVVLANNA